MKLFKFYIEHCPQCKILSRNLKGLVNVDIEEVDCEENEDLATKYQVSTLPTLVLVNDEGEVIRKMTGVMSTDVLQSIINCENEGQQ